MEEQGIDGIKKTIDGQIKSIEKDIDTQKGISKTKSQIKAAYSSFNSDDKGLKVAYDKQKEAAQKEEEDAKENIKNLTKSKTELEKTMGDVDKLTNQYAEKSKQSSITNVKMENLRLKIRKILSEC